MNRRCCFLNVPDYGDLNCDTSCSKTSKYTGQYIFTQARSMRNSRVSFFKLYKTFLIPEWLIMVTELATVTNMVTWINLEPYESSFKLNDIKRQLDSHFFNRREIGRRIAELLFWPTANITAFHL